MTLEEKVIVSAYTGYLMCDMSEVHKYIEKLLGRPIWTHELASPEIQTQIQEKAREAFLNLCNSKDTECKMCMDRHRKDCPHKNIDISKGETKMEGKVTTRKTKADLLEEIAKLEKQAERAGRYEQYDEAAAEIKAACDSFINAGFSREEALTLTLKVIESAGKVGR